MCNQSMFFQIVDDQAKTRCDQGLKARIKKNSNDD